MILLLHPFSMFPFDYLGIHWFNFNYIWYLEPLEDSIGFSSFISPPNLLSRLNSKKIWCNNNRKDLEVIENTDDVTQKLVSARRTFLIQIRDGRMTFSQTKLIRISDNWPPRPSWRTLALLFWHNCVLISSTTLFHIFLDLWNDLFWIIVDRFIFTTVRIDIAADSKMSSALNSALNRIIRKTVSCI